MAESGDFYFYIWTAVLKLFLHIAPLTFNHMLVFYVLNHEATMSELTTTGIFSVNFRNVFTQS